MANISRYRSSIAVLILLLYFYTFMIFFPKHVLLIYLTSNFMFYSLMFLYELIVMELNSYMSFFNESVNFSNFFLIFENTFSCTMLHKMSLKCLFIGLLNGENVFLNFVDKFKND